MSLSRKIRQYASDLRYACSEYQNGWSRPDVVKGYFSSDDEGFHQKIFFDELLATGFKRTRWQIVFPDQTAGLVRKIRPSVDGMDEIHVRFYDDATISAELEYSRWSMGHWREKREYSIEILESLLHDEMDLPYYIEKGIRSQFAFRDSECLNPVEVGENQVSLFVAIQYPITTAAAVLLLAQGEVLHALEPSIVSLLETGYFISMFGSSK